MNKILILGASGFIGNVLYKELSPYFDVYGTYFKDNAAFEQNQMFYKFDVAQDTIETILNEIRPSVIISSLRGDFKTQYNLHQDLAKYVKNQDNCRFLFLSTVNVFDGKFKFPSYENDTPLAKSSYGKYKISVEKLLKTLPKKQYALLRLPLVLGVNAPRMLQLKHAIRHRATFEVFPNLIVSITTANKIAQQVHFIINKQLSGIFHLSSNDMIHHQDLFQELAEKLGAETPIFKSTFTSNDDEYLAILPKDNKLPKAYRISVAKVVDECTLKEEIITLKK